MKTPGNGRPWAAWVRGIDPPIYLLSLFPPMVGAAATRTATDGPGSAGQVLPWDLAVVATAAFVLIHVAVNVFNDAFDAGTKADRVKHHSLARLTSIRTLHTIGGTCLVLGCTMGVALWLRVGGWHVPALSSVGVVLVFAYHAPPLRLSSRGGGEAVTFLGFGAIPVWTTAALATGSVPRSAWLPGIAVGLAAALVLWHHNVVSSMADGPAGKRTLATRMGRYTGVGTVVLVFAAVGVVAALWGRSAPVVGIAIAAGAVAVWALSIQAPRIASLGIYTVLTIGVLLAPWQAAFF